MNEITIGKKKIGPAHPVYIIAEISANHHQNFDQAVELIKASKEAGVDAVKLQTYTAETITLDSNKKHFQIKGKTLWDGQRLYDLYKDAYTPWEWQPRLKVIAEQIGLDLFSSAFDSTAVDFLEGMNIPAHKISSFEIVDLPLIEKMAKTKKPLIISTGMATLEEISEAVSTARSAGADQIALLKCTSAYPAPPDSMRLRTIPHLSETFQIPIGLSDHTLGVIVPVAAVAMGACIIEKHITLSTNISGPDSAFSLEPDEFKQMVESVRITEQALGKVHYGRSEQEEKNHLFRRSLFIVKDVKLGETLTEENIRSIRPGHGLSPKHFKEIIGRKATQDIPAGTPLDWSLVQ